MRLEGLQQLKGWDKVVKDFSDKDAHFKKIIDSQKLMLREL